MSNGKLHNKQIGLRIRAARKEKGMNQTELANLLGKSLRTIQKYESGEIEVSFTMINELAKVLDCDSAYLIGYNQAETSISTMSDIALFFFQLDMMKDIGFEIDVKRPPHHDGWECSISFNGKDKSSPMNQDICLFLEDFKAIRDEFRDYQRDYASYQDWKDKTLAYYANTQLVEKEIEELSTDERIKKSQEILNERYGKKES